MPSSSTTPEGPSSLPSDLREGYAEIGDQRLHYVEAGEGPLVVLLHGFPEFWYSWRHQLPALAAAGFHAIAPDLRGYNRSDRPRGVHCYRVRELVNDVAGLIERVAGGPIEKSISPWGEFLLAAVVVALMFAFVRLLYQRKIFLRL